MICSFCSLLCDIRDTFHCTKRESSLVQLSALQKSRRNWAEASCQLQIEATLEDYRHRLRSAHRILLTGRIASVQTARAVIAFASKWNATVDFDEHGSVFQNTVAMQRGYFFGASMAEVREQSDLLLIIDDGSLLTDFPALPTQFKTQRTPLPTLVIMGPKNPSSFELWRSHGFDVWSLECSVETTPKALEQWKRFTLDSSAYDSHSHRLLQQISSTRYWTIVWSTRLRNLEQPDLWTERLGAWIFQQNEKSRCVGLPLSSFDGTFQQVCTWLTGFPGRVRFVKGQPHYDPIRNHYRSWMEMRERTKGGDMILVIDETVSDSDFEFQNTLGNSDTIWISNRVDGLPVAIAGHEFDADIFRADMCVLAHATRDPQNSPNSVLPPSAAYWLEKLAS